MMKRASVLASLVTVAFLPACVLEVEGEPHGDWKGTGRAVGWTGHQHRSFEPARWRRQQAGCGSGLGNQVASGPAGHDPAARDAAPPPPPDAGMTPVSPDSGTSPPSDDPEPICRHDGQCQMGRCVAGACQRPCTTEETCGTGQVCSEGFCQPSPQPGGQCVYSIDCGSDATCVNGFCHERCEDDDGCSSSADRCDRGLCRPDVRPIPQCTATSQCPADRVCVDAVCRNPCRDDTQCGPDCSGTVCSAGYCFMPEELLPPPCLQPQPICGTPSGCPRSCAATVRGS